MNPKHIREIQTNEVLRKRLAKFLALHCFRNTELENLHSGTGLSRFDNDEMKALMIDVVNHCDRFLAIIFSTPVGDELIEELGRRDLVPEWNDPDWENDREPQLLRELLRKGLAAERKLKRKRVGKARGRPAGKK